MEGSHSPGNAWPHALPRDRRTALHDHAGAIRLLLGSASGARQIGARPTNSRPRIRNPGGAAGRDMDVAGAHPRRIRARRIAGISGANPLVSGTLGERDTADADLGDSFLRYWRQSTLASFFRGNHEARHNDALCLADANRM